MSRFGRTRERGYGDGGILWLYDPVYRLFALYLASMLISVRDRGKCVLLSCPLL